MIKRYCLATVFLVISSLVLIIPLGAAEKPAPQKVPAQQAQAPNVNKITQAAVKGGVLACTSRINQVTNFLTAGSPGFDALMFMPQTLPDQRLLSVSMEIPTKDKASAYVSASFAPNQANGCAGMYETVVYWPQKCADVARANFSGLKKIDAFAKNITVLNAGASSKVFLMPADKGCVSIKKELIQ